MSQPGFQDHETNAQPNVPGLAFVETLRSGRGYKFSTLPPEELNQLDWFESRDYTVSVSDDGLSLVSELGGYENVAAACENPADIPGATYVGEGSESVVYRTDLAGRDCAIKVVSQEVLELSGNNIFGYNFFPPDYQRKFGATRRINQILAGAPIPPDTFTLDEPITEYVAAKGFTIEQFVEGGSIGDMKERCKQTKDNAELIGGKPKAFWDDWYTRFDAERTKYKELFFAAGKSDDVDFNDPNWMITGFDEVNNRPVLTLIDQSSGIMTRGGDAQTFDDVQYEYLFQLYTEKYQGDPYLAYLRQPDTNRGI